LNNNPAVASRNFPETLKALFDSLRFDPFYVAISESFGDDEVRREGRWLVREDFYFSPFTK
jgi:hypothetical protein